MADLLQDYYYFLDLCRDGDVRLVEGLIRETIDQHRRQQQQQQQELSAQSESLNNRHPSSFSAVHSDSFLKHVNTVQDPKTQKTALKLLIDRISQIRNVNNLSSTTLSYSSASSSVADMICAPVCNSIRLLIEDCGANVLHRTHIPPSCHDELKAFFPESDSTKAAALSSDLCFGTSNLLQQAYAAESRLYDEESDACVSYPPHYPLVRTILEAAMTLESVRVAKRNAASGARGTPSLCSQLSPNSIPALLCDNFDRDQKTIAHLILQSMISLSSSASTTTVVPRSVLIMTNRRYASDVALLHFLATGEELNHLTTTPTLLTPVSHRHQNCAELVDLSEPQTNKTTIVAAGGSTPLFVAVKANALPVVEALVNMMQIVETKRMKVATTSSSLLLKALTARDRAGKTPLHIAVGEHKSAAMARLLLDASLEIGTNTDDEQDDANSTVDVTNGTAAANGMPNSSHKKKKSCIVDLYDDGSSSSALNQLTPPIRGVTALHMALISVVEAYQQNSNNLVEEVKKRAALVDLLLSCGANPNLPSALKNKADFLTTSTISWPSDHNSSPADFGKSIGDNCKYNVTAMFEQLGFANSDGKKAATASSSEAIVYPIELAALVLQSVPFLKALVDSGARLSILHNNNNNSQKQQSSDDNNDDAAEDDDIVKIVTTASSLLNQEDVSDDASKALRKEIRKKAIVSSTFTVLPYNSVKVGNGGSKLSSDHPRHHQPPRLRNLELLNEAAQLGLNDICEAIIDIYSSADGKNATENDTDEVREMGSAAATTTTSFLDSFCVGLGNEFKMVSTSTSSVHNYHRLLGEILKKRLELFRNLLAYQKKANSEAKIIPSYEDDNQLHLRGVFVRLLNAMISVKDVRRERQRQQQQPLSKHTSPSTTTIEELTQTLEEFPIMLLKHCSSFDQGPSSAASSSFFARLFACPEGRSCAGANDDSVTTTNLNTTSPALAIVCAKGYFSLLRFIVEHLTENSKNEGLTLSDIVNETTLRKSAGCIVVDTPLSCAMWNGHADIAKYLLLTAGADASVMVGDCSAKKAAKAFSHSHDAKAATVASSRLLQGSGGGVVSSTSVSATEETPKVSILHLCFDDFGQFGEIYEIIMSDVEACMRSKREQQSTVNNNDKGIVNLITADSQGQTLIHLLISALTNPLSSKGKGVGDGDDFNEQSPSKAVDGRLVKYLSQLVPLYLEQMKTAEPLVVSQATTMKDGTGNLTTTTITMLSSVGVNRLNSQGKAPLNLLCNTLFNLLSVSPSSRAYSGRGSYDHHHPEGGLDTLALTSGRFPCHYDNFLLRASSSSAPTSTLSKANDHATSEEQQRRLAIGMVGDAMKVLIRAGANPNLVHSETPLPLQLAVMAGLHDLVSVLITAGKANVNKTHARPDGGCMLRGGADKSIITQSTAPTTSTVGAGGVAGRGSSTGATPQPIITRPLPNMGNRPPPSTNTSTAPKSNMNNNATAISPTSSMLLLSRTSVQPNTLQSWAAATPLHFACAALGVIGPLTATATAPNDDDTSSLSTSPSGATQSPSALLTYSPTPPLAAEFIVSLLLDHKAHRGAEDRDVYSWTPLHALAYGFRYLVGGLAMAAAKSHKNNDIPTPSLSSSSPSSPASSTISPKPLPPSPAQHPLVSVAKSILQLDGGSGNSHKVANSTDITGRTAVHVLCESLVAMLPTLCSEMEAFNPRGNSSEGLDVPAAVNYIFGVFEALLKTISCSDEISKPSLAEESIINRADVDGVTALFIIVEGFSSFAERRRNRSQPGTGTAAVDDAAILLRSPLLNGAAVVRMLMACGASVLHCAADGESGGGAVGVGGAGGGSAPFRLCPVRETIRSGSKTLFAFLLDAMLSGRGVTDGGDANESDRTSTLVRIEAFLVAEKAKAACQQQRMPVLHALVHTECRRRPRQSQSPRPQTSASAIASQQPPPPMEMMDAFIAFLTKLSSPPSRHPTDDDNDNGDNNATGPTTTSCGAILHRVINHVSSGHTALFVAVSRNNLAMARLLLELGADVNAGGGGGTTSVPPKAGVTQNVNRTLLLFPLQAACLVGSVTMINELLCHGASLFVHHFHHAVTSSGSSNDNAASSGSAASTNVVDDAAATAVPYSSPIALACQRFAQMYRRQWKLFCKEGGLVEVKDGDSTTALQSMFDVIQMLLATMASSASSAPPASPSSSTRSRRRRRTERASFEHTADTTAALHRLLPCCSWLDGRHSHEERPLIPPIAAAATTAHANEADNALGRGRIGGRRRRRDRDNDFDDDDDEFAVDGDHRDFGDDDDFLDENDDAEFDGALGNNNQEHSNPPNADSSGGIPNGGDENDPFFNSTWNDDPFAANLLLCLFKCLVNAGADLNAPITGVPTLELGNDGADDDNANSSGKASLPSSANRVASPLSAVGRYRTGLGFGGGGGTASYSGPYSSSATSSTASSGVNKAVGSASSPLRWLLLLKDKAKLERYGSAGRLLAHNFLDFSEITHNNIDTDEEDEENDNAEAHTASDDSDNDAVNEGMEKANAVAVDEGRGDLNVHVDLNFRFNFSSRFDLSNPLQCAEDDEDGVSIDEGYLDRDKNLHPRNNTNRNDTSSTALRVFKLLLLRGADPYRIQMEPIAAAWGRGAPFAPPSSAHWLGDGEAYFDAPLSALIKTFNHTPASAHVIVTALAGGNNYPERNILPPPPRPVLTREQKRRIERVVSLDRYLLAAMLAVPFDRNAEEEEEEEDDTEDDFEEATEKDTLPSSSVVSHRLPPAPPINPTRRQLRRVGRPQNLSNRGNEAMLTALHHATMHCAGAVEFTAPSRHAHHVDNNPEALRTVLFGRPIDCRRGEITSVNWWVSGWEESGATVRIDDALACLDTTSTSSHVVPRGAVPPYPSPAWSYEASTLDVVKTLLGAGLDVNGFFPLETTLKRELHYHRHHQYANHNQQQQQQQHRTPLEYAIFVCAVTQRDLEAHLGTNAIRRVYAIAAEGRRETPFAFESQAQCDDRRRRAEVAQRAVDAIRTRVLLMKTLLDDGAAFMDEDVAACVRAREEARRGGGGASSSSCDHAEASSNNKSSAVPPTTTTTSTTTTPPTTAVNTIQRPRPNMPNANINNMAATAVAAPTATPPSKSKFVLPADESKFTRPGTSAAFLIATQQKLVFARALLEREGAAMISLHFDGDNVEVVPAANRGK